MNAQLEAEGVCVIRLNVINKNNIFLDPMAHRPIFVQNINPNKQLIGKKGSRVLFLSSVKN